MSKVLGAVSKIAGVVASVARFIPGGQTIAAIAGAVSLISGTLAQVTAKPPKAVGQVTSITVGANQPIPYMIGRSYSGGAMVHDIGYGGVVSSVDNPYRALTIVYSGAGPIQGLVATQADFGDVGFSGTAASGYYAGFLWRDWLDGTGPAPRALAAQFSGEPGWSAAHKMSGFFGVKYTLKFDKKGKVWQAGVPQFGVIADGVRAYDPRLDSTFPGGSGSQRINNEATWTFTKNPALHALTYSYGRYQNGKKVFGVDLGATGIDLVSTVAWANVCDANGWQVNGTIYEPGDKWNNLKLICEAGGGVPVPGARLRFDYNAAGVAVDTISIHDLADGEISLPVTQGYASRINTVQGVYTSPDHRWEPVPTDKIIDTVSLAADGEEKAEQFPFQMVTAKNQAAQLAAYKMANSREKGPIVIPVKARLLTYPVGTFLIAQLSAIGLASQKVKIIGKRRTMEDGSGEITVLTETDAKHAFALAATSGAPPSSALVPPERLDELAISLASPPSTQAPSAPPGNVGEGHIYIDGTGHKYRFSQTALLFGGETLLFGGSQINVSGWTDAQDLLTVEAAAAAQVAQATANSASALAAQGIINASNAQATADGANATAVATASNFNDRNDRIATAVVVPTIAGDGTAVDFIANPSGTVDISFEWAWAGTEADIDGFQVLARNSATGAVYIIGSSPAEESVFTVPASRRAQIFYGVDPTRHYTFAVRAFRVVDPDINVAELLLSVWVKPALAAENPFQPAANVAFTGDIAGTINGIIPTRNVNRGGWSGASVAYAIGDIVDNAGSSHAALVDHISTGVNGPPGANWTLQAAVGATGPGGLNNAVAYLYQRAASAPAAPAGTFTYTFANGL